MFLKEDIKAAINTISMPPAVSNKLLMGSMVSTVLILITLYEGLENFRLARSHMLAHSSGVSCFKGVG